MGYELNQLLNDGQRQTQFNRANYNKYVNGNLLLQHNNMVSPVTTNAYISAADMISFIKNDLGQQMMNLGGAVLNQAAFVNAVSDQLIAKNLESLGVKYNKRLLWL